ncbi:hypothetical protein [Deinococcus sp. Marseille-Q6407]|uniref:hypothetical protein n=1 Tax=Deinococcus sp. Marseille-Q6407 TaxID=2969223 RepID=UPI0021BEE7E9|nr:hypothetical protein [Deinococcus sp. Marseille-Q6407]
MWKAAAQLAPPTLTLLHSLGTVRAQRQMPGSGRVLNSAAQAQARGGKLRVAARCSGQEVSGQEVFGE